MVNDAVKCEKCGGEVEIGFVWDRCLKCGHLQNRDFETYRPKCDRCGCYLTDDNRVNDLCKACDDYFEQSQARQGIKHDGGKLRMSLLPIEPLTEVLTILEFGTVKYAPDNWQKVDNARTRYFDAAQRHILAWWQGELIDSESGKNHLAHAVCCLMFLMWFDLVGKTNDQ